MCTENNLIWISNSDEGLQEPVRQSNNRNVTSIEKMLENKKWSWFDCTYNCLVIHAPSSKAPSCPVLATHRARAHQLNRLRPHLKCLCVYQQSLNHAYIQGWRSWTRLPSGFFPNCWKEKQITGKDRDLPATWETKSAHWGTRIWQERFEGEGGIQCRILRGRSRWSQWTRVHISISQTLLRVTLGLEGAWRGFTHAEETGGAQTGIRLIYFPPSEGRDVFLWF